MKNGVIIDSEGSKRWFLNDLLHREDGPAIEWASSTKEWWLNGLRQRVDGPAIEWLNGDNFWYSNGELHREDGPACECVNGDNFWYLNGVMLSQPEMFEAMDAWFLYLNDNEKETYKLIHDHNGFIGFINNPSGKQTRVHQMAHIL